MSICQWFTHNLTSIGLAISFLGSVLTIGTRLSPTRKFGFWMFPEHKKRAEGYITLVHNGELLADESGFNELRAALFPTGENKVFTSSSDLKAKDLFSDENVKPVKIEKVDFKLERIEDGFPPTRPDSDTGIVMPEDTVTVSEIHFIADEAPHTPNINSERKLRRSYIDVDNLLESKFEDAMLYFGLEVLAFGFLLQIIALSGFI